MLFGPDVYPPHEPGTGSRYLHLSPWEGALDCLDRRQLVLPTRTGLLGGRLVTQGMIVM
ncbi:hypothetical protein [Microbispora bryophytorum]|uniref:Uncharacterized protein n=1 Tax=Microbispora bryophytorum subsp. camponoti TaxID=1677852 RepID=A0ABR8L574_9ACTN|nr:hypothetical protein [Microbispora camponoti]MBD3144685.1 hypothetical protein [Microbispora camponoti]